MHKLYNSGKYLKCICCHLIKLLDTQGLILVFPIESISVIDETSLVV